MNAKQLIRDAEKRLMTEAHKTLKEASAVELHNAVSGAAMDAIARALIAAADILEKSPIPAMLKERYASFDQGEGKRFEDGNMNMEELVAYAKQHGEPKQISGKQELYEAIVNMYV